MFEHLFSYSTLFSFKNNKNLIKKYYFSKKIDIPSKIYFPFCLDCRFYIPMEHSPLFPNSACKYFPKLKPCTTVRADEKLCGKEGNHFFPRINACKCKK
jgi:hypothetical protein